MGIYSDDRQASDVHLPQVKGIVGSLMLDVAPFMNDARQATDLMILRARPLDIAVRTRRSKYFPQYADEFTLRSLRDSGAETELSKVIDGFGDLMFYGFENITGKFIQHWHVLDLSVFRAACIRRTKGCPSFTDQDNSDGTYFRAFKISSFPANFVVAHSPAIDPISSGLAA
jgi:hypothetical protein